MAANGFTFIVNNILDDLNLNPRWEIYRKYTFGACVIFAIFPVYLTLAGISVECLPGYLNGTIRGTKEAEKLIYMHCSNDESLSPIRYTGCVVFFINIVVAIASSYWLHLPNVRQSLRTFAKFVQAAQSMNSTFEEFKGFLYKPTSNCEGEDTICSESIRKKRAQFLQVCRLVCFSESKYDLGRSYQIRNYILLTMLALFGILSVILVYLIASLGDEIICPIKLSGVNEIYVCSYNARVSMTFLTVAFLIGLGTQAAAIYYGYIQVVRTSTAMDIDDTGIVNPSAKLLVRFWESSHPLRVDCTHRCIQYVYSDEFIEIVEANIEDHISNNDHELIQIKREINKRKVPEALKDLTSVHTVFHESKFAEVLYQVSYTIHDCLPLAELLAKHELWKLLVIMLSNVSSDLEDCYKEVRAEIGYYFELMSINLDSIETPVEEVKNLHEDPRYSKTVPQTTGNSILYYAITLAEGKQPWYKVTMFLLTYCKSQTPYVHRHLTHGEYRPCESIPAEVFLMMETWKSTFNTSLSHVETVEAKIHEIRDKAHEGNDFRCQREIQAQLKEYKMMTRYSKRDSKYARYINALPLVLVRKKFHTWDESASTFFSMSSEKHQYEICMALLEGVFSKSPILCLDSMATLPHEKILYMAISAFEYDLSDCRNLAKYFVDNEMWKPLIALLHNTNTDLSICNEEHIDYFRSININLDALEQYYSVGNGTPSDSHVEDCKNVLFYAFNSDPSPMQGPFAVAIFVLKVCRPQKLYIHTGLTSYNALKYIKKDFRTRNSLPDIITQSKFNELKIAIQQFEAKAHETVKLRSQDEIHQMYLDYKEKADCLQDTALDKFIQKLSTTLLRKRFHVWDDSVTDFANSAAQNKHWKIVMSLINTLIETDDTKVNSRVVDHNIPSMFFDDIDRIWECIIEFANLEIPDGYATKASRFIIRNSSKLHDIISRLDERKDETYFQNLRTFAEELQQGDPDSTL